MGHSKRLFVYLILISITLLPVVLFSAGEKLSVTHGPYLLDPAEDSITVMWTTSKNTLSWVEYSDDKSFGTFPTWGGYPKIAKGSHHGLIQANNKRHCIRITNLKPGATYRYRVVSREILKFNPYEVLYGDTVVGDVHEFETLSLKKESFTFGVVADVHERSQDLDELLKNSPVEAADFIFFNGDTLNWLGEEDRIYEGFLDVSVKHFATSKPLVFIRGNHETRGPGARQLFSYFPHESGEYFYTLRQGDVFFIVLDCGEDKSDSHPVYAGLADFDAYRTRQAAWLKKVAKSKAFKESLYRVAMIHIPLFSGSEAHGASDLTKKMGSILNESGIDLMISGHHHRFKRIKPDPGKNRFPVVVLGKDMFMQTRVTKEALSVEITGKSGEVVDKFEVTGGK